MIRRLGLFFGCCVAFWAITSFVARQIWDGNPTGVSAVAMAICLIPSLATMAWATWAQSQSPDQQFTAVLGGTGMRLFVVLGVAYFLNQSIPYLRIDRTPSFWTWLLLSYMFTLAVETVMLVSSRSATLAAPTTNTAVGTHGA